MRHKNAFKFGVCIHECDACVTAESHNSGAFTIQDAVNRVAHTGGIICLGTGVYRLELKDGKVVAEEPLLTDLKTRIRDVRVGPDGAVYVLTDQKALLKLTPAETTASNR